MAAVLAEGETLMENCAREPEVADLAALLNAMGAQIEGAGTATIRVHGVASLHGARYRINPDRIEAGTFLVAGAITGGDLIVANCNTAHLGAVIAKLQEAGARVDVLGPDAVRVRAAGRLRAADISTEEYPGFPTDMQAQYMALATQAEGVSHGPRKHLREPLHARAGTGPHGRQHQSGRKHRHRARPAHASPPPPSCAPTCAPPHRWCWPRWSPRARPSSTASITWTAATSASKKKLSGVGAQIQRLGNVFAPKASETAGRSPLGVGATNPGNRGLGRWVGQQKHDLAQREKRRTFLTCRRESVEVAG